MASCTLSACHKTLMAIKVEQYVTSPYFPGHYASTMRCEFVIVSDVDSGIHLELRFLEAEATDTLQVFDEKTRERLHIFRPRTRNATVVPRFFRTRAVLLVFSSDATRSDVGFVVAFSLFSCVYAVLTS